MLRPPPSPAAVAAAATTAALGAAATRLTRGRVRDAVAAAEARVTQEIAAAAPSPEQLREDVLLGVLLERPAPPHRPVGSIVSDPIWSRLLPEDLAALDAALEGEPKDLWAHLDAEARRRVALNYIAHYELTDALERTGVRAAMPPEDVHAMARGALAAGGDPYTADLVFEAVAAAGLGIPDGGTVLDFGGSSGRVLRMVAAARPDLRCLGCDPNVEAIAWAGAHLPMAEFFLSPQTPPLALEDASVDMAFAISIWSHFDAAPALAWFEEMHRILKPGSPLVVTTHGFDCLAVQLRDGAVGRETAAKAVAAMVRSGHYFVDVFGPDGDWGVRDDGWGDAYMTLDWLQSRLDGRFATRLLWPGGLQETQDLVVLERR